MNNLRLNIESIIDCNFAGFKEEVKDTAVQRIMEEIEIHKDIKRMVRDCAFSYEIWKDVFGKIQRDMFEETLRDFVRGATNEKNNGWETFCIRD